MLSNNLHYDINSIAKNLVYSAYKTDLPNIVGVEDIQNLSDIKVRNTEKSSYANNVYFREGLKGEYVNVGLSDENLHKLREVFGDKAVKRNNDGNIVLRGKAEEFVSSWFNDIAYKRGYVKADSNNDGTLSLEEKYNTTAFFGSGASQVGNNVLAANYQNYAKATDFANSNDAAGANSIVLNSIEEELNRTLEDDRDMDGKIYFGNIASTANIVSYFRDIMGSDDNKGGYSPPSIASFFSFLTQTMKDLKKMLEEQLKKHLKQTMESDSIDLTAPPLQEVLKKIMEQENGVEALTIIKEQLEKEKQESGLNSNTLENATQNLEQKDNDSAFEAMAKLTKLDKQTLSHNLANNPNFEDDIIAIVQEIAQNVDRRYTTLEGALDINA